MERVIVIITIKINKIIKIILHIPCRDNIIVGALQTYILKSVYMLVEINEIYLQGSSSGYCSGRRGRGSN